MTPGSPEALANGCTCAAAENAHGQGTQRGETRTFVVDANCPLHGMEMLRKTYFPWLDESDNIKEIFSKT